MAWPRLSVDRKKKVEERVRQGKQERGPRGKEALGIDATQPVDHRGGGAGEEEL